MCQVICECFAYIILCNSHVKTGKVFIFILTDEQAKVERNEITRPSFHSSIVRAEIQTVVQCGRGQMGGETGAAVFCTSFPVTA